MPCIEPFCGLRYNPELINNLSVLISPPYDIISPGEQRLYYHSHEYNIIKLELGEEYPEDNESNNKYTRAASILQDWINKGVLVRDAQPALYVFQHCFPYRGLIKTRWGITVRLKLEDWETGNILPHEATLKEPTTDRLKLLRSCRVNLSPILGLFRHYEGGMLSLLPEFVRNIKPVSVTDHYGIEHRMWPLTDKRAIENIILFYADKKMYIADGHHRYQTALIYRQEQIAKDNLNQNAPYNYVMATLMDAADDGLILLPTHRLVKNSPFSNKAQLITRLQEYFNVEKIELNIDTQAEIVNKWLEILQQLGGKRTAIGVVGLSGNSLSIISLRDQSVLAREMPSEHCQAWNELDVSILHWIIIKQILNIDSYEKERALLEFTKDPLEAVNRVWTGEYQLAFLLNPASVESVISVANARDRMPQKSTYFYPKPPTGLVMNPVW